MLHFQKNYSLKDYNTFGLDEEAKIFVRIQEESELEELIQHEFFKENSILWLGGGSNMLLTQAYEGLVVKLEFRGKSIQHLNDDETLVEVAGGENWHDLVQWTISQGLGGLENLSLIPGNVGTAPIQNIGAYGVELKDHFESLKAFDLQEKRWCTFKKEDCGFGYRQSIFKSSHKGRYVITSVCFRLSRQDHQLHTDYGAIQDKLKEKGQSPGIDSIAEAVIEIRQSKLPDPAEIGNSGSFFKNPIVSLSEYERLKEEFPEIIAYPAGVEQMKLAAGWLIEKAGWKGYRKGDAGVHKRQALVLVNYGAARGFEIKELAEAVQESVYRTFAVALEAEVNII